MECLAMLVRARLWQECLQERHSVKGCASSSYAAIPSEENIAARQRLENLEYSIQMLHWTAAGSV